MLKESGRKNTTKSFMWAAYGGEPECPAVRFHYARTRAAEPAQELVGDYTGLLQTDGYSGYAKLCRERDDLRHVACFAHTRRKFVDASAANKKAGAAEQAIAYIGKLYAIEKNLASWERDEKFRAERERLATPVLEAFHDWLEK